MFEDELEKMKLKEQVMKKSKQKFLTAGEVCKSAQTYSKLKEDF